MVELGKTIPFEDFLKAELPGIKARGSDQSARDLYGDKYPVLERAALAYGNYMLAVRVHPSKKQEEKAKLDQIKDECKELGIKGHDLVNASAYASALFQRWSNQASSDLKRRNYPWAKDPFVFLDDGSGRKNHGYHQSSVDGDILE